MGGSMVQGLIASQSIMPGDITVADPYQGILDKLAESGVSVTTDNKAAAQEADVVMMVVKPWLVEQVVKEIKDEMDYNRQKLVVIAAGVKSEDILRWAARDDGSVPTLFLAIPNIAAAVMQSMTFVVPVNASPEDTKSVCGLFDLMGSSIVTEERLLAAGTTLASCGIAYAMRYVRAATEGGVELGFKAHQAEEIVLQTVKGAVELLQSRDQHPEAAIDLVTTPGGVTIKGLNEMEHAGFSSAVIRGLKAGMK